MLLLQHASCMMASRHGRPVFVSHMAHFRDALRPMCRGDSEAAALLRPTCSSNLLRIRHTCNMTANHSDIADRTSCQRHGKADCCRQPMSKVVSPFPGPRAPSHGFVQNMFRVYERRCVTADDGIARITGSGADFVDSSLGSIVVIG
jgi:hypothetical protein